MSDIDVTRLLDQMRAYKSQASGINWESGDSDSDGGEGSGGFSQMLKIAGDKVSGFEQHSNALKEAFERGDTNISLSDVMVAQGKANLSFQFLLHTRNKIVHAYEDIMGMPL